MMDVIIVDDEPTARRALREFCAREADRRVVGEYGDSAAALKAIQARPPHLLFLDIQIDALSGITLAHSLEPSTLPLIVFVTAYDQYALEAFGVNAVDYLLKPFDDERFRRTLARARTRRSAETLLERQRSLSELLDQLERNKQALTDAHPRIIAESGSRVHVLDVARVEVVEADRNYVRLRVGLDVYTTRSTLQDAERSL
jgi:two-component system, LytTR family, response regulator